MSGPLEPSPADVPSPIDGHQDPVGEGPWAMQLAVRYDKATLPTHTAVCEAAAQAVVTLLADERARGEGEWSARVHRWRDGRIRKLVRRARGQRWDRVQALDGVTVEHEGAQVRAFVPMPARPLPPELDALQVSGTDYPRSESGPSGPVEGAEPAAARPAVVQVALTPLHLLTTGKAAAQCGHAAQLAWEQLVLSGDSDTLRRWFEDGWRVDVHADLDAARWSRLRTPVQVVDAGFTEVDGPTETTRAWWDAQG